MTNTLTISREHAQRLIKGDASRGANALQLADAWKAMDELRAILAAPVVERQADPVAEWCDPLQLKTVIKGVIARERMRPTSLPDSEVADAVYAAITEHLPVYEDVYDQLSEMIEPHVKRPYRPDAPLPASVVDSMGFLLKAYASPPAPVALTDSFVQPVPDKCDRIAWRGSYYHLPIEQVAQVAVVLPERMTREQALELTDYPPESAMYWYNKALDDVRACLDKVKEMNK